MCLCRPAERYQVDLSFLGERKEDVYSKPSETTARHILQNDESNLLFQYFKIHEKVGSNLISADAAIEVISQTVRAIHGTELRRMNEDSILRLANVPVTKQGSRHMNYEELVTAYNCVVLTQQETLEKPEDSGELYVLMSHVVKICGRCG